MKNKSIKVLLLAFLSCGNEAQYNYELEDSKESYIMDDWSQEKKDFYYNKVSELQVNDFKRYGYTPPPSGQFKEGLKKINLNIIDETSIYKEISYHIFEIDSADGYTPQLILFPQKRAVSLKSELFLINQSNLNHLKSKDYLDLDNSTSPNLVLNKLLFSRNKDTVKEIKERSEIYEIENYLIESFHYSEDENILKEYIKRLIYNLHEENTSIKYLQLMSLRNKKEFDKVFMQKIRNIDLNNILLPIFYNSIQENKNLLQDKTIDFEQNLLKLYNIDNEEILSFYFDENATYKKFPPKNYNYQEKIIIFSGENLIETYLGYYSTYPIYNQNETQSIRYGFKIDSDKAIMKMRTIGYDFPEKCVGFYSVKNHNGKLELLYEGNEEKCQLKIVLSREGNHILGKGLGTTSEDKENWVQLN